MENVVNLNQANCIQSAHGFFRETIHNICDGTETYIQYGSFDIILRLSAVVVIAIAILVFIAVFISIIRG